MCKTLKSFYLKSGAKVLLFAHTAKQNAQKAPFCAQKTLFVQQIHMPFAWFYKNSLYLCGVK